MLANREGQRIPEVTFRTRQDGEWVDVTTAALFKGKTVVVFSLPGAFTPTCSSAHVPRFNELVPAFKANGVDDVVCVSVNDAFVMNEWQKSQHADRITFVPDGNAEFTEGMGLLVDKHDLGFGQRSWRYSMLVRDGVIEKMFIEPEVEGDPFEVSDADTMLKYINPNAKIPDDVVVFTKPGCPYCAAAKRKLRDAGIEFEEIVLGEEVTIRGVRAATGADTVPQMFANGERIGGSDAVEHWVSERQRQAA